MPRTPDRAGTLAALRKATTIGTAGVGATPYPLDESQIPPLLRAWEILNPLPLTPQVMTGGQEGIKKLAQLLRRLR